MSTTSIGLRPARLLRSRSFTRFNSVRNISQSTIPLRRTSGSPNCESFSRRSRSSKKPVLLFIENAARRLFFFTFLFYRIALLRATQKQPIYRGALQSRHELEIAKDAQVKRFRRPHGCTFLDDRTRATEEL